jgi:hypothetical protein
MNRLIALLLATLFLPSTTFAQTNLDIPEGVGKPRGAFQAFENEIDIKGIHLGDSAMDVVEILKKLHATHGNNLQVSDDFQFVRATSTNGRHTLNYQYLEGVIVNIREPSFDEVIVVRWGTPASGQRVDYIARQVKYKANGMPDAAATVDAVQEKYGVPTYYSEPSASGQLYTLDHFWFGSQKEPPASREDYYGRLYECQSYAITNYQYKKLQSLSRKCTAILRVGVTLDRAGRVEQLSQQLESAERHHDDAKRTDAIISKEINKDSNTGKASRL